MLVALRMYCGTDPDVVLVDEQKQFSQLAHHDGGLGREVCQHPNDRLVVLVEEDPSSLEFRQETLNGAPHRL